MFVKFIIKKLASYRLGCILLCFTPTIFATSVTLPTPQHKLIGAQQQLAIEHWETANGVRVYFVASHELPILDIQVLFDAGSARDGNQAGVAALTNALLNDGSSKHTEDQIATGFDSIGALFSNDTSRDAASVGLRTLTHPQQLQPALELLHEIITDPIFPAEAFAREQKEDLSTIAQSQQEPTSVAGNAYYQLLYRQLPYGHPVNGDAESVKKLTRNDLINFYHRYYVGKNAVIAIVGDITRAQAELLVTQLMGNLPAGEQAPPLPQATPSTQGVTQHIFFPAQQSTIVMGQVGISYNDPNYFPLAVGNYIFGGNPGVSHLFNEVRAKRGLSYRVESYFLPMRDNGPFTILLQTRNEQASQALTVTKDTFLEFITQGPSTAELTEAQRSITGSFPLRMDSNNAILANVALIGFYRLPLDYLNHFNDNVNAVTVEQIKQAFQQHFKTQELNTVIVGR